MGLRKEVEKTGKIIEFINEMFENHDKIIHYIMEMNKSFEKQIEIQNNRIDLIFKKLKEMQKDNDSDERNKD